MGTLGDAKKSSSLILVGDDVRCYSGRARYVMTYGILLLPVYAALVDESLKGHSNLLGKTCAAACSTHDFYTHNFNSVFGLILILLSYCIKFLHMPRQHSCRGMCKKLM